jgi:hypothetical protein
MERRDAVRYLAWILAGAATQACTPLRIVTRSFPAEFKNNPELVGRTLRAFVAAVIPGVDPRSDPARALLDRRYPFAAYAAFFASDLSRRAERRYGTPDFAALALEQRTAIVEDGLAAGGTTGKLYRGAIYLTQVSIYAGIYDDDSGCALIDFPGRYRGEAISYADPESFLPAPLTAGGNAA